MGLRGGVWSLVGGVELSERPDEPAVDGLPSVDSFFTEDFFRAGTPSGHVHCNRGRWSGSAGGTWKGAHVSLAVGAPHAVRLRLVALGRPGVNTDTDAGEQLKPP